MTHKNFLNPRPTPQPITAVMLEHIGATEEWEWYNILFDCTLQDAINSYYEDMYSEEELDNLKISNRANEQQEIVTEDCRAYYITI